MWHLAQHNDFVVALLGYLAVFVVLALIYIACLVMGSISKKLVNESNAEKPAKKADTAPATVPAPEQNTVKPLSEFADRRAAVAAISAAIAADLGTDTSKIRITSIKKIG